MPMLIIDAQAHIYADDSVRFPPADNPIRPPGNSGAVNSLEALAAQNRVAGMCVVQPGSYYRWDNRFICDVSKAHPDSMAGVTTLDPDNAESPKLFTGYVKEYGVRGLRSLPAADGHLAHPGVSALWGIAQDSLVSLNVFINPDLQDELARMLEKFSHLPVVIDHSLMPRPSPDLDHALAGMIGLARFSNAYAKLSFLPLASAEEYPFRDLHDACKKIIAAYGPERCVWGSNFPCELWTPKASYAQNLRLFTEELGLSDPVKEAILGRTAQRLWFKDRL